jgi:hypothetical protein
VSTTPKHLFFLDFGFLALGPLFCVSGRSNLLAWCPGHDLKGMSTRVLRKSDLLFSTAFPISCFLPPRIYFVTVAVVLVDL